MLSWSQSGTHPSSHNESRISGSLRTHTCTWTNETSMPISAIQQAVREIPTSGGDGKARS